MDSKQAEIQTASGIGIATPQLEDSDNIKFFDLPRKARNEIYKRLLTVPHPLYFFQDPGGPVQTFAPDRPHQWLALLLVNRQMTSEVSAVLYGRNKFVLMDTTRYQDGLLQAFLERIGSINATFLTHLGIKFPAFDVQQQGFNAEDNLQKLQLIREKCTSLRTLEAHVYSEDSKCLTESKREDIQLTRDILCQFEQQLQSIPSLIKTIIRVYAGRPTPTMMEFMQRFGWEVLPGSRDQW